jgi:hypothetical protein
VVLLQPTERLKQMILSIARDRLSLALAPRLKLAARDPRPLAPPATPTTPSEHQLGIHLHILLGLLGATARPLRSSIRRLASASAALRPSAVRSRSGRSSPRASP